MDIVGSALKQKMGIEARLVNNDSVAISHPLHFTLFFFLSDGVSFSASILFKVMHRSELLPQGGRGQPSKSASGLSDKSKQLSKSSMSSKCLTTEQTLQGQIVQLKEKAHQSFMQVIQMQQLHEEELQLLRAEFAERETQYQLREEQTQTKLAELEARTVQLQALQLRVKQLQFENTTLERNYKQHHCDLDQDQLEIDNIELITCREESSKLDDSAIINFTEIININRHEEQMRTLNEEIRKEVEALTAPKLYKDTPLGKMVDKLFEYIVYVRTELVRVQNEREKQTAQSRDMQSSKFYQSLQKETKFMTDHIKRLSGEKLKLEKRLIEEERHNKALQEKLKKLEGTLSKKGIKLDEVAAKSTSPSHQEHQRSLEIDEFISENMKNTNPIHKAHYGLLRKTNKQ